MIDPSKIRRELVYHLGVAKLNLGSSGFSNIVQPVPSGAVQGSKSRIAFSPLFAVGFPAKNCGSPPTLACKTKRVIDMISLCLREAQMLIMTYHGSIAKQSARSAERVGDEIEGLDGASLQIPERTPGRVVINLQGVICGPVKKYGEGGGDNNRLEC